jgi:hypothetical protein
MVRWLDGRWLDGRWLDLSSRTARIDMAGPGYVGEEDGNMFV